MFARFTSSTSTSTSATTKKKITKRNNDDDDDNNNNDHAWFVLSRKKICIFFLQTAAIIIINTLQFCFTYFLCNKNSSNFSRYSHFQQPYILMMETYILSCIRIQPTKSTQNKFAILQHFSLSLNWCCIFFRRYI